MCSDLSCQSEEPNTSTTMETPSPLMIRKLLVVETGSVHCTTEQTVKLELILSQTLRMKRLCGSSPYIPTRKSTTHQNLERFCSTFGRKCWKKIIKTENYQNSLSFHYRYNFFFKTLSKHSFKFLIGPSTLKVMTSSKGKPKILYDGFSYFQNCKTNSRIYWICSRNRLMKCTARIITSPDFELLKAKKMIHNHGPDGETSFKKEELETKNNWINFI